MNLSLLYSLFFLVTSFSAYGSGSVVTWGRSEYGGDSSSVASELSSRVTSIYSTYLAFAALKEDGSVSHLGVMIGLIVLMEATQAA